LPELAHVLVEGDPPVQKSTREEYFFRSQTVEFRRFRGYIETRPAALPEPESGRRKIMNKIAVAVVILMAFSGLSGARQGDPQDLKITIKDVPAFTYIFVPHSGPISDIQDVIGTLMQAMQTQNLLPPRGPMMGIYYLGPDQTELDTVYWEIGFPGTPQANAMVPLQKKEWTLSPIASTMHVGPYSETIKTIQAVIKWLGDNGYARSGPVVELYMDANPAAMDPSQLRTEVWVPCRKIEK
jgi:effector-binding domain-containing protein